MEGWKVLGRCLMTLTAPEEQEVAVVVAEEEAKVAAVVVVLNDNNYYLNFCQIVMMKTEVVWA
jgi:hypothetical protein